MASTETDGLTGSTLSPKRTMDLITLGSLPSLRRHYYGEAHDIDYPKRAHFPGGGWRPRKCLTNASPHGSRAGPVFPRFAATLELLNMACASRVLGIAAMLAHLNEHIRGEWTAPSQASSRAFAALIDCRGQSTKSNRPDVVRRRDDLAQWGSVIR